MYRYKYGDFNFHIETSENRDLNRHRQASVWFQIFMKRQKWILFAIFTNIIII